MDCHQNFGLNSLRRLRSLCQMLRDDADRILSGSMGVTITSQTLYELNGALDNLQDGLSPPHLSPATGQAGGQGSRVNGCMGGQGSELEEWNFYLQLVLDIVAKAPVLVLYRGKQNGTPSLVQPDNTLEPIRLGYFTGLTHLEISFLPIRAIEDLLKMRDRLETLVVISCVADNFHLQDVLEMCDQGVSVPMQWVALKTLCVRCNSLRELDGSLRLCPRLERLDLSRNRLATTDVYLGYLMELSYIDLSYNNLTTMPSFSATAKKKIRVLLLTGNKLVNIRGVEEMTSLEELDVSENLISSHSSLTPLRVLHRLDKLNTIACPASIRKDHRLRTLQHVSTVSLSRKFSLDGHLATHKEIQNSRALLDRYNHQQFSAPVPYNTRQTQAIVVNSDLRTSAHSTREQQEEGGAVSEDTSIKVTSIRSKKGRKKAKARMLDIPDMDTSTGGELSSREVTPSTTPKNPSRMEAMAQLRRVELQEKRAEIEHLRRYYGNSWLQAVEDKEVIPRPASLVGVSGLVAAGGETSEQQQRPASARELENVGSRQSVTTKVDVHTPNSKTHGDRVREHEAPGAENKGEDGGKKTVTAKVDIHAPVRSRDAVKKGALSGAEARGEGGRDSSPETGAFNRDTMFSSSAPEDSGPDLPSSPPLRNHPQGQHNESMWYEGDESRRTEETLLSESGEETVGEERRSNGVGEITGNTEKSSATNSSTLETVAEPEDQSEPFIVTLPSDPDHHLIVTVSPRYLVEKDINGVMQDQLDLQSLEAVRVEVYEVTEKSEDMDEYSELDLKEIRVSLDFSYVRKDRRCREYVMEDIIAAQHFRDLVQPFVDTRVEAAMKKLHVQHQCLKCSCTFSRAQAQTLAHSDILRTGSTKDFLSLVDKGGDKVALQCPKCSSDHVVQLESGTESDIAATGLAKLPSEAVRQSFLRHRPSFDQLMGNPPPVAHSTPLKHNASTSDVPSAAALSHRRGSKPSSFRSLFGKDDQDYKQHGDGPNSSPNSGAIVGSLDSASAKRDSDSLLSGRTRSNAFYNQPPEACERSNAVSSPQEFLERQTKHSSGSVLSDRSDTTDTTGRNSRTSTSNTLTRSADVSHLATFGAVNNLHLAFSSSVGSEASPARSLGLASVDSDIMILNKRDSGASVVVLASSDSASDTLQTDISEGRCSSVTEEDDHDLAFVVRKDSSSDEVDTNQVEISARGSRKLTPVPQECDDSVEVTPMGSPLSSSICSSMVSSVYHNSLLPTASASSVYVTASDFSGEEKGGGSATDGGSAENEDGTDDNELSIYDQVEAATREGKRRRQSSTHKMSISSEVEVLCVEEESTIQESWQASQDVEAVSGQQQAFSSSTTAEDCRRSTDTSSPPSLPQPLSASPSSFSAAAAVVAGTESAALEEGSEEGAGEDAGYDFARLDHRLTLYLMMTVFTNDEEFKFKVKSCVSQYMMANEYEALVVVTTLKLYILRINTEDPSVELTEGLTLMEAQPHAELKRVDFGLGNQTLRVEYGSDCSSYTLILRDEEKLDAVKELLSDQLQFYAMETGVPVSAVFTEDADQLTMDNLTRDVLTRGSSTDSLQLYTLGYIARGHNPKYPVAFVVSSEVILVKTNHQWPSPHLQAPVTVDTVGKQFTVLERQSINNIATLEIHEEDLRRLRITFFNEMSGDETQWLITMETEKGVRRMVEAIRQPWEEAFGVEMDVECSPFPLTF